MKKLFTLAFLITLITSAGKANAQALSGAYPIPSSYFRTFKSFLDSLNKVGVAGPVTANINFGMLPTETAPPGGYFIGSDTLNTGPHRLTLANSLTINGNACVLVAPIGTGSTDGVLKVLGADFVTINDLHIQESAANTTATTRMEWGYAVVKRKQDDGVKTLSLQRCKISLSNANTTAATGVSGYGSSGIFIGNCLPTSTAALAPPTVTDGSHDGIFIFQDTITNVNNGVFGYGTGVVIDGVAFNDNGVTIMNNKITNFTHNGIHLAFFNNDFVSANYLNNITDGGVAPTTNSINGIIYNGSIATATNNGWRCEKNVIDLAIGGTSTALTYGAVGIQTIVNGTGTTVITEDTVKLTASGVSGQLIGIYSRNASGTQTISKNMIQDFSAPATNLNHAVGIWNGQNGTTPYGYPVTSEIKDNVVRNFDIKNGNLIAGCIDQNVASTNPSVFTGNVINNFSVGGAAAALKGYQFRNGVTSGSVSLTATGNTFTNFSATGSAVPVTIIDPSANITVTGDLSKNTIRSIKAGTGFITGVQLDYAKSMKMDKDTIVNMSGGADVYAYKAGYTGVGVTTLQFSNSLIDSLASSGASSVAAAVGITPGTSNMVTTVALNNNMIKRIQASGATASAYGLNVVSGTTTYNIYNNMLSDIAASSSITAYSSSFGLNLQSSGVNNVYFNTINLVSGSAPATGFGATGFLFNASGNTTLQNNIFRVNVLAGTANNATAVRSLSGAASAAPSTSAFNASNNIYYTPTGASNFLYVEGTTNSSLVNGFNVSGLTPSTTKNIANDTFFNSDCGRSSYHNFMQAALKTRESGTYTENNLTGSAGSYMPSGITYAESGAKDVATVSDDFSATLRTAGASDIGALEFVGTVLPKMNISVVSSSGLVEACVYNLPKLSATIPAFFNRVSYQWYSDTGKISGATNSSMTVGTITATYIIKVYDSVTGCEYSSTPFLMTIQPPPPAFVTYYDSLVFCETSAIVLNGNKGKDFIYQWYKDGAPLAGESNDHLVASTTGQYSVEVNTPLGCPTMSESIKITVYPLPNPSIYLSGPWLMTQKYYTYQWYKNNVKIPAPDGTNQRFYPREDGAYTVEVTDSNGCTSKSVIHLYSTAIPNATLAAAINVFPNPASGMVHIESPVALSATLSDIAGRVIWQQEAVKDLDMSVYAEGMYLLNLYDKSGSLLQTVKLARSK